MNELNTLKMFTALYVSESDLSNEDKLWLIDFIKEGEHDDIIDILEGQYQLPQISEYLAEKLHKVVKKALHKAPPIPKKVKKKGNPLRIRKNLGTSEYIGARQKRKAAEKKFGKFMPDASKESVKAVKHAVAPLRSKERKALGKAALKVGSAGGTIGLAGVGAQQSYQNFMSRAVKICKGRADREKCMRDYKNKAKKSKNLYQIKRLRVSKSDCIDARNPAKCRQKIDSRIRRLKEDIFYEGFLGKAGKVFDVLFVFELGAMAYKRFFSKASKACKGSPDRKLCMLRFKIKAKEAQIKTIKSKAGMCAKDPNPTICKNKIMKKVQSLKSDIAMLKQELV